ncbi:hypothetical protein COLO4_13255 [Corchorus olitorius]|uniref:F-box/LRR-repeat protein n=1 Tax=Corchorus olitorius TaxID=93759 RepID=A0A1R3JX95_9ROSI|nr:hypothetical protein COLO4_13255 [Corchorus olitorius]
MAAEIPEVKKRKNSKRRERKQKRRRDEFVWKDITRVDDDKDPSKRRRWEDMDHVILVNIMKRLLQVEQEGIYTYYYFSICKSWFAALLGVYFPYGNYVFDLRPFYELDSGYQLRGFRLSLMLVLCLRPTTHYSKMVVGKDGLSHKLRILRLPFYEIYKILMPSLRELELPYADAFHTGPFWPFCYEKLEAIFCSALKLPQLVRYCKCIHTLRLYGTIGDGEAYLIAKSFPLLKHLEIPYCVLSVNALPIILNCHKICSSSIPGIVFLLP